MSGGEYDYRYSEIEYLADALKDNIKSDGRRALFVDLLYDVAATAKAIEWEDSGDTEEGSGSLAIKNLFDSICGDEETLTKAKKYDMIIKILDNLELEEVNLDDF